MTHTNALKNLLEALKEHRRVAGQIHSISPEEVRVFLNQLPEAANRLKELDPQGITWAVQVLIDEIGFLNLIQIIIAQTDEGTAAPPVEPDRTDPMEGDARTGLASTGQGTAEGSGPSGPDEGGQS